MLFLQTPYVEVLDPQRGRSRDLARWLKLVDVHLHPARARAGAAHPQGARPPPEPEDEADDELAPEEPPAWERILLSKSFRLVVGATFAAAAIVVLVFLIGPSNITRTLGYAGAVISRSSSRLGGLASVTIASAVQDESRRLWVETATPLPAATATSVPEPTATPFPTPPPPRRPIDLLPTPPSRPVAPGQPLTKPPPPPALPYDAAQTSMTEYFSFVASGDVRRALQYWSADAAPEARSALDAAVARGEKYIVKGINARPLPQIYGADIVVDLEVSNPDGKSAIVQQRYQWRFVDNQWFITARLQ